MDQPRMWIEAKHEQRTNDVLGRPPSSHHQISKESAAITRGTNTMHQTARQRTGTTGKLLSVLHIFQDEGTPDG
jgi:hypothetical protein